MGAARWKGDLRFPPVPGNLLFGFAAVLPKFLQAVEGCSRRAAGYALNALQAQVAGQ